MQKIPKGIVAIAVVIVVTGFIFYQYATEIFQGNREGAMPTPKPVVQPAPQPMTPAAPVAAREVSALTTYDVPEADITHNVRYTVALDAEGRVLSVAMVEMPKAEASDKQKEFSTNLTAMIKGKKLSELTKVDRVGKSTITTNAFNSVIDDLQAKL